MHSYRLIYVAYGILICVQSVYSMTCGTEFDDIQSSALQADVVFMGTVEGKSHTVRDVFNGTFRIKKLFKGHLPKRSRNNYKPVNVGKFGAPDEHECIAAVEIGASYIVFLKPNYRPEFPYYEISAFPEPANKRNLKLVRRILCKRKTCGRPPKLKIIPRKDVKVREGRRIQLRCKASGRPPPQLTWWKDDKLIQPHYEAGVQIRAGKRGRSRLRIPKAKPEHSGRYMCRALNLQGETFKQVHVQVDKGGESSKDDSAVIGHKNLCSDQEQGFCLNGGTCYYLNVNGQRNKLCVCKMGFIGNRCQYKDLLTVIREVRSRDARQLDRKLTIAGLVIACLVFIAMCIASYILARKKRLEHLRKQAERRAKLEVKKDELTNPLMRPKPVPMAAELLTIDVEPAKPKVEIKNILALKEMSSQTDDSLLVGLLGPRGRGSAPPDGAHRSSQRSRLPGVSRTPEIDGRGGAGSGRGAAGDRRRPNGGEMPRKSASRSSSRGDMSGDIEILPVRRSSRGNVDNVEFEIMPRRKSREQLANIDKEELDKSKFKDKEALHREGGPYREIGGPRREHRDIPRTKREGYQQRDGPRRERSEGHSPHSQSSTESDRQQRPKDAKNSPPSNELFPTVKQKEPNETKNSPSQRAKPALCKDPRSKYTQNDKMKTESKPTDNSGSNDGGMFSKVKAKPDNIQNSSEQSEAECRQSDNLPANIKTGVAKAELSPFQSTESEPEKTPMSAKQDKPPSVNSTPQPNKTSSKISDAKESTAAEKQVGSTSEAGNLTDKTPRNNPHQIKEKDNPPQTQPPKASQQQQQSSAPRQQHASRQLPQEPLPPTKTAETSASTAPPARCSSKPASRSSSRSEISASLRSPSRSENQFSIAPPMSSSPAATASSNTMTSTLSNSKNELFALVGSFTKRLTGGEKAKEDVVEAPASAPAAVEKTQSKGLFGFGAGSVLSNALSSSTTEDEKSRVISKPEAEVTREETSVATTLSGSGGRKLPSIPVTTANEQRLEHRKVTSRAASLEDDQASDYDNEPASKVPKGGAAAVSKAGERDSTGRLGVTRNDGSPLHHATDSEASSDSDSSTANLERRLLFDHLKAKDQEAKHKKDATAATAAIQPATTKPVTSSKRGRGATRRSTWDEHGNGPSSHAVDQLNQFNPFAVDDDIIDNSRYNSALFKQPASKSAALTSRDLDKAVAKENLLNFKKGSSARPV